MNNRWVVLGVVAAAFGVGCKEKAPRASAAGAVTSLGSAPTASAPGSAAAGSANGACSSELDYLIPPAKYGDGDLFRAIVADSANIYFRNMKDVFRVPISGGKPTVISQAPGLSLSGRTALFESGDRLLTQSSNEPIFMAAPKAGGAWTNIIDLTARKLGGGRDAATRILQGLGSAPAPRASQAAFDGSTFYWAEVKTSRGLNVASSSSLRSVSVTGGAATTLFESPGEMGDVAKAGDRVVFMRTAPPTPEQLQEQAAQRKAKKIAFAPRGVQNLMSVPAAGGEAKTLARISNIMTNVVLGTDGSNVYVSGYADEDLTKPGIYRVDANGAGLVRIDPRPLHGHAFVVGDKIILAGSAALEPGQPGGPRGQVVLSVDRGATSASRVGCISDGYTAHAYAVAGKTLLISLFQSSTNLASIAKIPLP